jgi:hypothetical protein
MLQQYQRKYVQQLFFQVTIGKTQIYGTHISSIVMNSEIRPWKFWPTEVWVALKFLVQLFSKYFMGWIPQHTEVQSKLEMVSTKMTKNVHNLLVHTKSHPEEQLYPLVSALQEN